MRYKVANGSESGHCCFEATVTDTHREGAYGPNWVCECFDLSRANQIADALNTDDEAPLAPSEEEIYKAIALANEMAHSVDMQGGNSSEYRAIIAVLEWATGRELTGPVPYYVKPVLGIEEPDQP